jgi:hypothetical protein
MTTSGDEPQICNDSGNQNGSMTRASIEKMVKMVASNNFSKSNDKNSEKDPLKNSQDNIRSSNEVKYSP